MGQARENPFFLVLSYGPPHNCAPTGFPGEKRHSPSKYVSHETGYAYYAPKKYEAAYESMELEDIRATIKDVYTRHGSEWLRESALPAVKGYFGAITALDDAMGRLLDYLDSSGLLENTVVVFTSDHGEALGSHGMMTKGTPFEESIRVPLSIRVPGQKGEETPRLFNSPDVMPTLLGLAGIDCPANIDSIDHSDFLLGKENGSSKEAEMAYIGYSEWRGWRARRYAYATSIKRHFTGRCALYSKDHYGETKDHLLFDLENDPLQQRPIVKGDSRHTDSLIDDFHDSLRSELNGRGETIKEKVG